MVLIVWSSGIDSTALVMKCLKENIPFETMYIYAKNLNEGKIKRELECRKEIRKLLSNHYKTPWKDRIVKIGYLDCLESKVYTIGQPYLWQYGALRGIDRNTSEVWFGYIKLDTFWHCKSRFEKAYYSNLALIRNDDIQYPEVKYPFEWETKEKLIDTYYLTDIGKKVFKLTWTCESVKDNGHRCGTCNPCKVHKNTLKYFKEKSK